jgi:hypothetical protein
MAQRNDSFPSKKHVCIFELERGGAYCTGDVVCMVCGLKISSLNAPSPKDDVRHESQPRL